ncbi:MAG: recombinase family protein [Bifidobacterium crudilactis]|nr:recombinase family protein [Bifidobacterium crudilactis]MCI2158171.1 recombinase family protein [Bifidobacterium crudilactis]
MNRPVLKEMIAYLKDENTDIDYLIVHQIDRLARNRADDVAINQILDQLGIQFPPPKTSTKPPQEYSYTAS